MYFFGLKAEEVWLLRAEFDDDVVLAAADVGNLNLADTAFRRSADLSGLRFRHDLNTTRIRASQPIQIGWHELGDEWARGRVKGAGYGPERIGQVEDEFRFWKRNFAQLGNRPAELKANYYLIQLDKSFRFAPTRVDWWAATLLELPSQYGTRPFRPLFAAVVIVLGFAVLFGVKYPFESDPQAGPPQAPLLRGWRALFGLGYSLDLFLPVVEVSGVFEWGWRLRRGRWQWIGALERVIGVLVTAATAYSVGSYFV